MKFRLINFIGFISLGLAACSPAMVSPTSVPLPTRLPAYPSPDSISTPIPAYPAPTIMVTHLPLPTLPEGVDVSQFQELVRWGEGPLQFISLSPSASQYLVATLTKAWITPFNSLEARIELQSADTACQNPLWSNSSVRWMKGEKRLVIGYWGGICIWNTADGSLATYIQSDAGAQSLDISPDGSQLVWTGASSPAWIATIDRDSPIRELQGAAPEGYGWGDAKLAWSPDGTRIAGVAPGPTAINLYIAVWDAQSGKLLERFPEVNAHRPDSTKAGLLRPNYGCGEGPVRIEWSPDSKYLGLSEQLNCDGYAFSVWGIESQTQLFEDRQVFTKRINFTWSNDSQHIVWTDAAGVIKIRNLITQSPEIKKSIRPKGEFDLSFSDPQSMIIAHIDGILTRVPDIFTDETYQTQKIFGEFTLDASAIAWGTSQQLIAVGRPDGTIGLWDINARGWANSFNGHSGLIKSVAWLADASLLASVRDLGGNGDPSLRIWEAGKLEPIQEFLGGYEAFAFSPDASLVAVDISSQVWIFNVQTGEQIQALELNQYSASLAWSPNGHWLAALTPERLVMWDTQTWQIIRTAEKTNASSLSWSPDSRLLAWGGGNANSIQIQEVESWRSYRVIQQAEMIGYSLAWSPDGVHLAGGKDKVQIWDAATGAIDFTASTQVADLAWNNDGSQLTGVSDTGSIYIWGLATP